MEKMANKVDSTVLTMNMSLEMTDSELAAYFRRLADIIEDGGSFMPALDVKIEINGMKV